MALCFNFNHFNKLSDEDEEFYTTYINSIYKMIADYNSLIDDGAFFRLQSVFEILGNIFKQINTTKNFVQLIYFDKITDKKISCLIEIQEKNSKIENLIETIKKKSEPFVKFNDSKSTHYFIYYDNAHTVGTDVPNQPSDLTGIVTVDENSRFTTVSQACYRIRKLNYGQTVYFLPTVKLHKKLSDSIDPNKYRYALFSHLITMDTNYKNSTNFKRELQYVKYKCRKYKENLYEHLNLDNFKETKSNLISNKECDFIEDANYLNLLLELPNVTDKTSDILQKIKLTNTKEGEIDKSSNLYKCFPKIKEVNNDTEQEQEQEQEEEQEQEQEQEQEEEQEQKISEYKQLESKKKYYEIELFTWNDLFDIFKFENNFNGNTYTLENNFNSHSEDLKLLKRREEYNKYHPIILENKDFVIRDNYLTSYYKLTPLNEISTNKTWEIEKNIWGSNIKLDNEKEQKNIYKYNNYFKMVYYILYIKEQTLPPYVNYTDGIEKKWRDRWAQSLRISINYHQSSDSDRVVNNQRQFIDSFKNENKNKIKIYCNIISYSQEIVFHLKCDEIQNDLYLYNKYNEMILFKNSIKPNYIKNEKNDHQKNEKNDHQKDNNYRYVQVKLKNQTIKKNPIYKKVQNNTILSEQNLSNFEIFHENYKCTYYDYDQKITNRTITYIQYLERCIKNINAIQAYIIFIFNGLLPQNKNYNLQYYNNLLEFKKYKSNIRYLDEVNLSDYAVTETFRNWLHLIISLYDPNYKNNEILKNKKNRNIINNKQEIIDEINDNNNDDIFYNKLPYQMSILMDFNEMLNKQYEYRPIESNFNNIFYEYYDYNIIQTFKKYHDYDDSNIQNYYYDSTIDIPNKSNIRMNQLIGINYDKKLAKKNNGLVALKIPKSILKKSHILNKLLNKIENSNIIKIDINKEDDYKYIKEIIKYIFYYNTNNIDDNSSDIDDIINIPPISQHLSTLDIFEEYQKDFCDSDNDAIRYANETYKKTYNIKGVEFNKEDLKKYNDIINKLPKDHDNYNLFVEHFYSVFIFQHEYVKIKNNLLPIIDEINSLNDNEKIKKFIKSFKIF